MVARTKGITQHSKTNNLEKMLMEYSVDSHKIISDLIQSNQQSSVEMDNRDHSKDHMPN